MYSMYIFNTSIINVMIMEGFVKSVCILDGKS